MAQGPVIQGNLYGEVTIPGTMHNEPGDGWTINDSPIQAVLSKVMGYPTNRVSGILVIQFFNTVNTLTSGDTSFGGPLEKSEPAKVAGTGTP